MHILYLTEKAPWVLKKLMQKLNPLCVRITAPGGYLGRGAYAKMSS